MGAGAVGRAVSRRQSKWVDVVGDGGKGRMRRRRELISLTPWKTIPWNGQYRTIVFHGDVRESMGSFSGVSFLGTKPKGIQLPSMGSSWECEVR